MDPIGEKEYQLIIQTAQQPRPNENPQQAALRGAADVATIGLMRDCQLTLEEAANARWHHLEPAEDGSGRLTIAVSKANPVGVAYVSSRTMAALQAMRRLKQSMGKHTVTDDRIFQMGGQQLGRRIRDACSFAGLEGKYGASSPRAGMLMDLARSGITWTGRMHAGRWMTPAVATWYMRKTADKGAVSQWYQRNLSEDASI